MQEMKQIKDLKKGDRVSGTNGGVIQITKKAESLKKKP